MLRQDELPVSEAQIDELRLRNHQPFCIANANGKINNDIETCRKTAKNIRSLFMD